MGEHEIEAPERVIDRGPTKQPGWSETALGWVASVLMVVVGGYFTLQTIGFCLTRAFEEGSWRAAGLLVLALLCLVIVGWFWRSTSAKFVSTRRTIEETCWRSGATCFVIGIAAILVADIGL